MREWRWLEEALGESVIRVEPVTQGSRSRENAWRVETRDGRRFAVKQVPDRAAQTRDGYDALTTEWEMLPLLHKLAINYFIPKLPRSVLQEQRHLTPKLS